MTGHGRVDPARERRFQVVMPFERDPLPSGVTVTTDEADWLFATARALLCTGLPYEIELDDTGRPCRVVYPPPQLPLAGDRRRLTNVNHDLILAWCGGELVRGALVLLSPWGVARAEPGDLLQRDGDQFRVIPDATGRAVQRRDRPRRRGRLPGRWLR